MRIIETTVNMEHLIRIRNYLKHEFSKKNHDKFEEMTRILMSEETKQELDNNSSIDIRCQTILEIKILIDNDIPFGECEIFINAVEGL